jgi:DNA ligase-1
MLYSGLVEVYEQLEATSKRLEKTSILAVFLKKLKHEGNKEIVYLVQGRIFPDYDQREIGVSTQLIIKALAKSVGMPEHNIVNEWKLIGDLGKVAEKLVEKKKQHTLYSKKLTAEKVLDNLRKLTEFIGKGTVEKKMGLIAELLTSASPLEAKYIVRTILNDLRIGVGTGVLRDAIVEACYNDKEMTEKVQAAYDMTTDFALVFELACKGKKDIEEVEIYPGRPLKVMLFLKVKDIKEGFEAVGKPAAIEYKYDGFRMMIHKTKKGEIKIFTRRLDEVTSQFPEVKGYVEKYVKGDTYILDSEAVGYDPKTFKYRPFQDISQRIKRKYNIEKLQKELPVEVDVFDILYYNGKNLLKTPFIERRKIIEHAVTEKRGKIKLAEEIITDNETKAQEFYKEALKIGEEGVMIKKLEAPYKPGARVGSGVKLKPEENEFDLVIVKAEYGTGKRAGWLTSYTVACRQGSKLLEIGKFSTGLKEKEEEGSSFIELTKLLKPLIIEEHGREVSVKPKIVVTVRYQNIQESPTYGSGYAMRFPRFVMLRPDRSVDDIATLAEVERDARKQQR